MEHPHGVCCDSACHGAFRATLAPAAPATVAPPVTPPPADIPPAVAPLPYVPPPYSAGDSRPEIYHPSPDERTIDEQEREYRRRRSAQEQEQEQKYQQWQPERERERDLRSLAAVPATAPERLPLAYTPRHLAEKILTSRSALAPPHRARPWALAGRPGCPPDGSVIQGMLQPWLGCNGR
jgi:hypothetical protein